MSRYADPAAHRSSPAHSLPREIAGLFGELLITLGAFCMLFVVWQLWWTDVVSDADADEVIAAIEASPDAGIPGDPGATWVKPKEAKLGDAIALVRIPRFGKNYVKPMYEGTTRAILRRGIGHYEKSVMPGEIGNFSMAGHRTTYGKPFNKIALLIPGDRVIIETPDTYFVYQITDSEIVGNTDSAVLFPVPREPGVTPTKRIMTMTSCHPEFSSRERYIQHGELEATYPRAGGLPAEVLEVAK